MSKAKERAYELYPDGMGAVYDDPSELLRDGYMQACKDFEELIKERLEAWTEIYGEGVQYDIKEARMEANAVLDELENMLKEIKDDDLKGENNA